MWKIFSWKHWKIHKNYVTEMSTEVSYPQPTLVLNASACDVNTFWAPRSDR